MAVLNIFSFWMQVSRGYSFPMSIMSWSIPFLFGLLAGGNIFYGLIALIGILFAHAGVNMFDDFIDYIICTKKSNSEISSIFQKGKCKYLLNGSLTLKKLFFACCFCFSSALICGVFLTLKTGMTVVYLTAIAGFIGILYPLLSYVALGEAAVAVIFAPVLYTGVYYVMTMNFSTELLPIAISTGLLTVALLHAHMFLDIDFDKKNRKKTICLLAGSKKKAVYNQLIIMSAAYFNIAVFIYLGYLSKFYLLTFLSLPTAIILYKIMNLYAQNSNSEIKTNIFFGILENLKEYKKSGNINFMIIFLTARNVMVEFTALILAAKIIREIINVYL